jgi:hypothetical protein
MAEIDLEALAARLSAATLRHLAKEIPALSSRERHSLRDQGLADFTAGDGVRRNWFYTPVAADLRARLMEGEG